MFLSYLDSFDLYVPYTTVFPALSSAFLGLSLLFFSTNKYNFSIATGRFISCLLGLHLLIACGHFYQDYLTFYQDLHMSNFASYNVTLSDFILDHVTHFGTVVLVFLAFCTSLYFTNIRGFSEKFTLFFFLPWFGTLILASDNLYLTYFLLEGFSLSVYILCLTKRTIASFEATIKYFFMGTVGSLVFLWGVAWLYLEYGVYNISSLFSILCYLPYDAGLVGLTLILLGLGIKLGMAPFHFWPADVYEGVTSDFLPVLTLLVKGTLLFLLWRLEPILTFIHPAVFAILAVLSLILGPAFTILATSLPRFVAYGFVAQFGFLLLVLAVNPVLPHYTTSTDFVLFNYMFAYLLATIVLTPFLVTFKINSSSVRFIHQLFFIVNIYPRLAIFLIVAILSLAGLPPFYGFFAKLDVWIILLQDLNLYTIVPFGVSLIATLVSYFYYLEFLRSAFFEYDSVPVIQEVIVNNSTYSAVYRWSGDISLITWTFSSVTWGVSCLILPLLCYNGGFTLIHLLLNCI